MVLCRTKNGSSMASLMWSTFIFKSVLLKMVILKTVMHQTLAKFKISWKRPSRWMFKGIVHPKCKFCHCLPTLKLFQTCIIIFSKHKRRSFENIEFLVSIDFHSFFFLHTTEVNGNQQCLVSKYFLLCLDKERNSCRFGTTWGWVNDDRICIFG